MFAITGKGPSRKTIRGLNNVGLVTEDVVHEEHSTAKGEALNKTFNHDLRILVEEKLKKNSVGVLTPDQLLTASGSPFLHISVLMRRTNFLSPNEGEVGCILVVALELCQVVLLQRNASITTVAPTWTTGSITVVPQPDLRSSFITAIEQLLDEFLSVLKE